MEQLIARLEAEQCSCVISNAGETRVYRGRGISDLYHLYRSEPHFLREAAMADKVVGKGAAALMATAGIKEVYAGVISLPAFVLLRKQGVEVRYGKLVPFILNRAGNGWCPLETRCQWEHGLPELLAAIRHFVEGHAALPPKNGSTNG